MIQYLMNPSTGSVAAAEAWLVESDSWDYEDESVKIQFEKLIEVKWENNGWVEV